MGTMLKTMTKMTNSLVGYIALLRQLASFCKGWVGDHCRDRSIHFMAYMASRGWGKPTPPIYIHIYINYHTYGCSKKKRYDSKWL